VVAVLPANCTARDVPEADDSNDVKNPLHDPVVAKIDDVNNDPQTTTPKPPRRGSETSEWARDVFSLTTSSGSEASQKKQRNLNRTVEFSYRLARARNDLRNVKFRANS
jgi:hypothetical protein